MQEQITSLQFVEWIAFRQLKAHPERLELPPADLGRAAGPATRPSNAALLAAAKGMGAVIVQPGAEK